MKKYVICMDNGKDCNAATKARQDAEEILRSLGCEPFLFPGERTAAGSISKQIRITFQTLSAWHKLNRQAEAGSLVVLQYPFFPIKTVYLLNKLLPGTQKRRNIRFIALVHDLNSLRGFYGKAATYSDTVFLKHFDHVISHNKKMTEYLQSIGIPKEKMTELTLFDYLTDTEPLPHSKEDGIAIAGNLDPGKSGYILPLIQTVNLPVHLYGRGLTGKNGDKNVFFHGAFSPEVLPGKIEGGFGLVWDGPSAETCAGRTGGYLKYNNPHKLSLYLAAGMPVIIWKEAADASLIRDSNAGLLISRLSDIEERIHNLSEQDYRKMAENAGRIGRAVRKGQYLAAAMDQAGLSNV